MCAHMGRKKRNTAHWHDVSLIRNARGISDLGFKSRCIRFARTLHLSVIIGADDDCFFCALCGYFVAVQPDDGKTKRL